jgi:hypothetical protein
MCEIAEVRGRRVVSMELYLEPEGQAGARA